MAGDHLLAQRADDQGRRHEQPGLGQQRDRHRQADVHQRPDAPQARPLEMIKQAQPAVVRMPRDIDAERQHLQPQHDRRGHAAAVRALRRDAQPAEHQHVAQRHQQQQPAEAEIHRRSRQRQPFGQAAQREVAGERRRAPADRQQKGLHVMAQARRHPDQIDQRRRVAHREPQQHALAQRQPQRLPEHRAHFPPAPGAIELRHRRRHRHHHADAADDRQRPDAGAHRHRTEHVCADVPGEHRVDHVAADRGQLGQYQRQREAHGGAHLVHQAGALGAERFDRHGTLQGRSYYPSHSSRPPRAPCAKIARCAGGGPR